MGTNFERENAVFLGGTVAKNKWRDGFITRAVERGVSESVLFNPVTDNWDAAFQALEDSVKANADLMLFYLGDTQDGSGLSVYSITEATMGLYDDPNRTVVVFDYTGIEGHALKAQTKIEKDLRKRFPQANIFGTLAEAEDFIVNRFTQGRAFAA